MRFLYLNIINKGHTEAPNPFCELYVTKQPQKEIGEGDCYRLDKSANSLDHIEIPNGKDHSYMLAHSFTAPKNIPPGKLPGRFLIGFSLEGYNKFVFASESNPDIASCDLAPAAKTYISMKARTSKTSKPIFRNAKLLLDSWDKTSVDLTEVEAF
ncbi:MAG: hypothetical protein OK454_00935 [Thaumarchaeota archaeon]|nr:hypothetical protein [Nitrososphaerota archaeon]